ncbi:MAG TPA: recombinase family protein [Xanthobacteraceae bacterium]
MAKYGYARVSTEKQDYTAQVEALLALGCQHVYAENVSGKSTNGRHELATMLKALKPGDTVVVTKLDRIARSSRDLHNILGDLQDHDVGFVSLGESWCDTTSDVGRFLVTIMGGLAEFERSLIRARCEAGIARARAQGKKFGRKAKLDNGQRRKIAERYGAGETMAELAKDYGVGEATIWRVLR